MTNLFIILFFICFICLFVGLIKPGLVIRWGIKRNRKQVVLTYVLGMIVSFVLIGITAPNVQQTTTTPKTTSKDVVENKVNDEKEKSDKIKELQETYKPVLESGKSYSNMTDEEGNIALAMVTNWNTLNNDFKENYKTSKDTIESSIKEYNDKKVAEEKAAKEAEEAVAYDTGITYDQLARTPDNYNGKKAKFTGKVIQVMEQDGETDLRIAVDGNYDTILLVAYDPKIISSRILEKDSITVKGVSNGIYTYDSTIGGKISVPLLLVDKIELNK